MQISRHWRLQSWRYSLSPEGETLPMVARQLYRNSTIESDDSANKFSEMNLTYEDAKSLIVLIYPYLMSVK